MLFLSHLGPSQTKLSKETQCSSQTQDDQITALRQLLSEKETQFEQLHQQLMSELQLKSDEMDIESQQIQSERVSHSAALIQQKRELEQQF